MARHDDDDDNELFEIELFICIKMDLALNNLEWLIYLLTKTINQSLSKC